MANNNVQNVRFLRNGTLFTSREQATSALTNFTLTSEMDGSSILARYQVGTSHIKTLVGYVYYKDASNNSVTIFDVDDAGSDVDEKIKTAIEALDSNATSVDGKNIQVKVTETDGKIAAVNITTDNTVNSGDVATAIGAEIGKLDYPDVAVAGQYVSQVSQADGKIAVERVPLPSVNAISEAGMPITAVSESLGTISATAGTINAEYVDVSYSAITAKNVKGALAEIADEIDAMNKAASAVDGQVVTTVSEADGKVSETKANVKDLQLGGYSKDTAATGDIASTDTINAALSKLENKAAAITIANADGSINVTTATTGTDINVNIKSGERVIAKDGNAGLYTNIAISAATSAELAKLGTNVQEAYKLVATDGTKLGEFIKIYKDSSLVNLYLGHVDDLLSGTTAQTEESESSVVVPGSGSEALVWIVQLADGKYKLAAVDVESFLQESEFKDGLQVSNHEVSVKVDSTSEVVTTGESATANVLSVSSEGVKVGNIQAAIDYKVSTLDATVGSQTVASGNHVAVEVSEADGKLTAVTVTERDIASAQGLADEITARTNADTELSNRLGDGVTTKNTASSQLSALSGTSTDASGVTSVWGAKKYAQQYADEKVTTVVDALNATVSGQTADGKVKVQVVQENGVLTAVTVTSTDIASDSALAAEIAARKDVDGQAGQTYAANTSANYISGATSLNDADVKLDAALKSLSNETVNQVKVNGVVLTEENNAVNAQIDAAAGAGAETAAIAVNTDKSTGAVTISLLGLDCGTY